MYRAKAWWAAATMVGSLYTGQLLLEPAHGRFHAQTVVCVDLLRQMNGWPNTRRADFDQQFLARLKRIGGNSADILAYGYRPSYIFRWRSTGAPHAQAYMRDPADEEWYQRAWEAARDAFGGNHCVGPIRLAPQWDAESGVLFHALRPRWP